MLSAESPVCGGRGQCPAVASLRLSSSCCLEVWRFLPGHPAAGGLNHLPLPTTPSTTRSQPPPLIMVAFMALFSFSRPSYGWSFIAGEIYFWSVLGTLSVTLIQEKHKHIQHYAIKTQPITSTSQRQCIPE